MTNVILEFIQHQNLGSLPSNLAKPPVVQTDAGCLFLFVNLSHSVKKKWRVRLNWDALTFVSVWAHREVLSSTKETGSMAGLIEDWTIWEVLFSTFSSFYFLYVCVYFKRVRGGSCCTQRRNDSDILGLSSPSIPTNWKVLGGILFAQSLVFVCLFVCLWEA